MTNEKSDEQRRNYLKDEYLLLQNQYEDYDKRSLTIKSWVSGGAIAALALAFNSSYKAVLFVPVIVGVIVAVIWYLEAYWKLFQYALADRIRMIEAYFRNDPDILIKDMSPFQIYHWWFLTYTKDQPIFEYERRENLRPKSHSKRLWRVARQRFVCLPYLPILALCAVSLIILIVMQIIEYPAPLGWSVPAK
jgi:hypothetical protein